MARLATQSKKATEPRRKARDRARSGRGSPAAGKSASVLICVLLFVGTIALYGRVSGYPFVIVDDWEYVTQNAHIHEGLSWSMVKWAFTTTTAANWHPLTWISHAFDYQFFALNAGGHHIDSLLIHATNAVLIFLGLQWLTKRRGPSILVAVLFACHPINVESVAWIAERKNLLCTLFFLVAIGAYAWYAQQPRWPQYLAVVALFALGLMAKPMVITLPFVLLLLDYWPLGRMGGSPPSIAGERQNTLWMLLAEKAPLLLLSAVSAVITVKAQGYAVRRLYQITLFARIENAIVAYSRYLWNTIWPQRLAFAYPLAAAIPVWQWLLAGTVLAGISTLVIVFRKHRYLPVGWFWFLGMLVPVIGLVQVGDASMADRYAYLPLIGIFIVIAWGADDLISKNNVSRTWQYGSAMFVVVVLGFVTYRQIGYWDSEYDLWSRSLEITGNVFAEDALGAALMDPQIAMSPEDLQQFDTQERRLVEARLHLEKAVALRGELAEKNPARYLPDRARALNNLANLAQMEGNDQDARIHYEQAISLYKQLARQNLNPDPEDWAITLDNAAHLETRTLRNGKAKEYFAGAVDIYRELARQNPERYLPKLALELDGLAASERDEKQIIEARRDDNEALQIRRKLAEQYRSLYLPSLATTLNDLGVLDGMENKPSDAVRHFQEALTFYRELSSQDSRAYAPYLAGTLTNLARSCASDNRLRESGAYYGEAVVLYQKLARTEPGNYADALAQVQSRLEEVAARTNSK